MKQRCNPAIFFPLAFFFSSLVYSSHSYLPSSFGATNFIVGVDSATVRTEKSKERVKRALRVDRKKSSVTQVFFTPDDDVRSVLLDLIACEQKKIWVAAFLLTDAVIARALLDAQKGGVKVEVVVDRVCCKNKHGKVDMLCEGKVCPFVYCGKQPAGSHASDIMHNKFVIFDKNIYDFSIVWTGSFNFTHSARLRNQENVLVLNDQAIVERYKQQFELIKKRSRQYEKNIFGRTSASMNKKKNSYKKNKPSSKKAVITQQKISSRSPQQRKSGNKQKGISL